MESTKKEFLKILSNYQGILHKVNLVYFKIKSDREDNLQEIIYQLWKSFPNLKNRDSLGSWIYAISIHTSISRLKKQSRIEYRESIPELSDTNNFFNELTRSESLNQLLNAIHKLDEINRSIMLLYLEEKSYEEIAEILGITKSNVGARISRAKEILKQNLKS
ncbi:MAG: RNA polymerase sigma factor [Bacteroidota bacterium]